MASNYNQYQATASSQQNYIKYLQDEIQRLQNQNAGINNTSKPENPSALSLPVRHADITQVKNKKDVLSSYVELGTSNMYMMEDEEVIFVKSIDKDGHATLYTYLRQEPEDISSETEFVTKADLKTMLDDAVQKFSDLVPKEDSFVRKDEIRDLIVESISSMRSKKREEE